MKRRGATNNDHIGGVTRRGALGVGAGAVAGVVAGADAAPPATGAIACHRQKVAEGWLSLYALSPRAFRIRIARGKEPAASTILLADKTIALRERRRTAEETILRLPFLTARVRRSDGALTFFDSAETLLLAEQPETRGLADATVQDRSTVAAVQGFVSPPDERLYGTGQFQDGFLNLRGLSRRLTQVNTQISLPFLLSSKGYGLLWHNTGRMDLNPLDTAILPDRVAFDGGSATVQVTTTVGTADVKRTLAAFETEIEIPAAGRYGFQLDCGQAMASKHYVEIDGRVAVDVANLWLPPTMSFFAELSAGRHRVRVVGDAKDNPTLRYGPVQNRTVLSSPVSDGIDYIVIAGPKPDDILAEYRRLTGTAPMLPKWAFGYIHCRERYHSAAEILANAKEFRARKIPMDVIVQDWQYWGRYGWNAMRFDETDYPDPGAMIASLHGENVRFMLSVWSKVDRASDVGKALASRNCLIANTDWIDFFDPRAAALYWGAMRHNLLPLGIDAWWQDATEPENDDLAGRMTAAGPGELVRLQYPLEVTRTVYEGLRRDAPGKRAMILTRSAFLGEQRFGAAVWSGDIGCDWDTLKRQIPAGLNVMAAGHPYWTVDAGGFFRPGNGQYADPAYHELLLRWLQYAAFLPLMRVHGYQTTTEPWHYGPAVEAQIRRIIETRYRLLPYIYSAAADVTRNGGTMMRPLVLDFPGDPAALDQTHSFLFGRSLHVAPVFAPGATTWDVYLPRTDGGWYDFWTGERRPAGIHHTVAAPIERIPVHVRAGSIVPRGPVVQSTAEADGKDIAVTVYPGADGRFDLYEDAGTDYGYEKGHRSVIRFAWHDRTRTLTIAARRGRFPGMPESRQFTLSAADSPAAPPIAVTYTGQATTRVLRS